MKLTARNYYSEKANREFFGVSQFKAYITARECITMTIKVYSNAKNGNQKLSANFKVREFACKDESAPVFIDSELVDVLQKIRGHSGKPVTITSAYRTPSHNKTVGGAIYSQHLYGRAADIKVSGVSPAKVAAYAEQLLPTYGGIGIYDTFTHIDVRDIKARWKE